jgi:hypothetical protein
MKLDWFMILRDAIMLILGIDNLRGGSKEGSRWKTIFGVIIIALVVADVAVALL